MSVYEESGCAFDSMDESCYTDWLCPECGSNDVACPQSDGADADDCDYGAMFCFDCQTEFRL